jgi:hypothetical protein
MHCSLLASHPAGQRICLELKIHASNLIKACARRFDVSNSDPGEVPFLYIAVIECRWGVMSDDNG